MADQWAISRNGALHSIQYTGNWSTDRYARCGRKVNRPVTEDECAGRRYCEECMGYLATATEAARPPEPEPELPPLGKPCPCGGTQPWCEYCRGSGRAVTQAGWDLILFLRANLDLIQDGGGDR